MWKRNNKNMRDSLREVYLQILENEEYPATQHQEHPLRIEMILIPIRRLFFKQTEERLHLRSEA